MKNKDNAVQSALILTAVNLFAQILGFAYRVWLSRLVGPVGLGVYQLIMPVHSVIMSLCVSGLTVAVSRLTATYSALANYKAVRQVVRNCIVCYVLLVMAASLLIIPLSDAISVHFLGDARTQLGLILLMPCILLTGWENVHKNFFYGSKNVIPPAVAEIVEQISRALAILGLLFFLRPAYEEAQVGLIVMGMIISEVLSAGLLTMFFHSKMRKLGSDAQLEVRTGKYFTKPLLPSILAIAAPVATANVASNMISSINSIIIPGRLITAGMDPKESLSAYGVAFGMTMPLIALPLAFIVSVSLVMLPRLAENIAVKNYKAVRSKINTTLTIATCCVIPITALLIPFGQPVAQALFKNENAGAFMVPLAIATVFVCYEYVLGSMLNGMGLQNKSAVNYITSGLLQLVLTWYLVAIPELRLFGYVLAYGIGNAVGAGLCLLDVMKFSRKTLKGERRMLIS